MRARSCPHWRIENSPHRVLGVGFDGDRARNRRDHGLENLATLRKLALNVRRKARPDISIRRKRKRSGWSDAFARTVQCDSPSNLTPPPCIPPPTHLI